ncbi:formimidoylglutamate deiminase [Labedella phragmitis]|uniref:Formimidoylglutamate deiminase n=1 Tax=Labedella phragmitis TaxID=2498849 RepID=A0A444PYJ9_9MICO|nr:formimidoylglutamate deiminase [Labedella phragmitis]RWZ52964.1 formimidoylglutamate deiminase [Labedella phragmitis]
MTTWWAEFAWLGGERAEPGVLIETDGDRIVAVTSGVDSPPDGVSRLDGLVLPGLVNGHSHAFHRALRGRTQADRGSFWTWRERMYAVATRLDPESYHRLARATFAEMLLAGITTVGEFHYVHHRPDGAPYDDPAAMGDAIVRAADEAGIRLTLLDTCYLTGGFGTDTTHVPLSAEQRRFGDGTAERWAVRASSARERFTSATVRVGAAVHSVRAVPGLELPVVAAWAREHEAPLHVHLSEQPAENADCERVYGRTPTRHLAENGVLGRSTTAVHATHLTDEDVELIARERTSVCFCVTTERDLADGVGPSVELAAHGVPLTLGSDSHAVIDLFEEARGVELDERLVSRNRGHFTAAELLTAATLDGAGSLGWDDAGRLAVGMVADFVSVRLDSVRTAGYAPDSVLETVAFAATAADVSDVVVGGRIVVSGGRHIALPDVAGELRRSIAAVTEEISA